VKDIDFWVNFVPNPNLKNWVRVEKSSCVHTWANMAQATLVRDKSCYWKCHKEHIENLGNMMGTLWELDQNTIEKFGNLMGTPWELDQNTIEDLGNLMGTPWELIRTQLRTWGTYWKHFENLMGTPWELGEPTGNTLRTWWEHLENRQKTTPPETPSDCQRPHFVQQQREGENMGVWENMGMLERKERRTWTMGVDDWVRFWERTWVCSYLL
jgi:hypothetical protein